MIGGGNLSVYKSRSRNDETDMKKVCSDAEQR